MARVNKVTRTNEHAYGDASILTLCGIFECSDRAHEMKSPLRDYFLRYRGRVMTNNRCRYGVFLALLSRRNARLFLRTLPSLPCAPVYPARTHMERSRGALPAFAKDTGSVPQRAHGERSRSQTSEIAMIRSVSAGVSSEQTVVPLACFICLRAVSP